MKTSKTMKSVRIVGNAGHVFNDKLKHGVRSLKVWGWSYDEYIKCKQILELAGCSVKVVTTPNLAMRLHVVE